MPKIFLVLYCFFLTQVVSAHRLPFSENWTVFAGVPADVPAPLSPPEFIVDASGRKTYPEKLRPSISSDGTGSFDFSSRLRHSSGMEKTAILYNKFISSREQEILLGCGADWYMEIQFNGQILYSTLEGGNREIAISPSNHTVRLPVKKGENHLSVKVSAGTDGWKFLWGPSRKRSAKSSCIEYLPSEKYAVADMSGTGNVQPGTALDLSRLMEAPAGKYGRVIILPNGHFGFADNLKPVRFFGFSSGIPEQYWDFCSDREFPGIAAAMAQASRAQGYNFFRMHGLDYWIMRGSKRDLEFSPRYLDRMDRLIAEMKQQGIYLGLVGFSYNLYGADTTFQSRFQNRNVHKLMMLLGRKAERERFSRAVTKLLSHVNPYTGLAWKDDPAIVTFEFQNEQYLALFQLHTLNRKQPEAYAYFMNDWKQFLHEKYRKIPVEKRPKELSGRGWDQPPVPSGRSSEAFSAVGSEYWQEKLREMNLFCTEVLRKAGYRGLVLNSSAHPRYFYAAHWETLPVVDAHAYYGHPSKGDQPGSKVFAESPVRRFAEHFRNANILRLYGRPFTVGEYNHCFWNPYQYEYPLAFTAYAAFAGFDSLAIHVYPVWLGKKRIRRAQLLNSFSAGVSPVQRAGEFLGAMLFLRGDVAPAEHRVALMISRDHLTHDGNGFKGISAEQSKLALLTGLSVLCPDIPRCSGTPELRKPDLVLLPVGASEMIAHEWYSSIASTGNGTYSLGKTVEDLRSLGILSRENRTDIGRGIFQTESGELTLRAKDGVLSVLTPRTEAIVMPAGKSENLNVLSVTSTTANALIGITSIDDAELKSAKRMVLVYATCAFANGMILDHDRTTLIKKGDIPPLLENGRCTIRLQRKERFRCFALRLDGTRKEEIPVSRTETSESLEIRIDTAGITNGATPFFELIETGTQQNPLASGN